MAEITVKQKHGYKIRGIEPDDLRNYPPSTRKMYWQWVVEYGLKRKDLELSQGKNKDGGNLRPISAYTRTHRRSAMTPTGKGDPSAPPLTPAHQLSRTRSLLAGRALSTHAEFFWGFDPWTGDTWNVVLSYQATQGRDVFGLSPQGTTWVKQQADKRWAAWKKAGGPPHPAVKPTPAPEPIVGFGTKGQTGTLVAGVNAARVVPAQGAGWMTRAELDVLLRGGRRAPPAAPPKPKPKPPQPPKPKPVPVAPSAGKFSLFNLFRLFKRR